MSQFRRCIVHRGRSYPRRWLPYWSRQRLYWIVEPLKKEYVIFLEKNFNFTDMNMIYFFLCFKSWYSTNSRLSFLISNIFINKSQGRSIVYCVFGQKWPRGYITSEKRCKIDAYSLLAIIRSCFEVHVAGTLTRGWGRGRGGGCCRLSSYNRLVIKDGRWTMRTHRIQCLKK